MNEVVVAEWLDRIRAAAGFRTRRPGVSGPKCASGLTGVVPRFW